MILMCNQLLVQDASTLMVRQINDETYVFIVITWKR